MTPHRVYWDSNGPVRGTLRYSRRTGRVLGATVHTGAAVDDVWPRASLRGLDQDTIAVEDVRRFDLVDHWVIVHGRPVRYRWRSLFNRLRRWARRLKG